MLRAAYQSNDAIPGQQAAPVGQNVVDQSPTFYEHIESMFTSEVGALGYLFGHTPQHIVSSPGATDLETPAVPGIPAGLVARMQHAGEIASTKVYQPAPYQVPIVEPAVRGTWSFTDTLRNELAKVQDRISSLGRVDQ